MKTPDVIKSGLNHCSEDGCKQCPYKDDCDMADGFSVLAGDANAYIQQLENHISELSEKVAKIEAAQPKWISVKERLPETNMRAAVLYRFPGSSQLFMNMLDYYATDPEPHFQHTLGAGGPVVEYWMELPEMRNL